MAMPAIARHFRNYASAGMLSALAGVVSFPILTRYLSVEEYGILGLLTSSITLAVALGKLGLQHSVIRYFAQIREGNIPYTPTQLDTTVTLLFLGFACATTTLWLLAGFYVLPHVLSYHNIATLFLIGSAVVFIRILGSGTLNSLRARQQSGDVARAQILARYLNLSFILLLLLFSDLNPYYLLSVLVVAETVSVAFALRRYWPDFRFRLPAFSGPLACTMLVYGVPLMMLESLVLVLRLSDRYLIEAMLGEGELGLYSASYNLTAYLEIIVLAGIVQAVKPMYLQIWESRGRIETEAFLQRGLQVFVLLGLPVVALFSVASPHLMGFLASEKYIPGTVIIPFVAFSFLLDGSMQFLAAGLYIRKNTRVLMLWGAVATVLNIVLNLMLIPLYGIMAAAAVTVVSYLVFMLGVAWASFRHLSFAIYWKQPLVVGLASWLVYLVLHPLQFSSELATLLFKSATGVAVLAAVVLAVDPRMRRWCLQSLNHRLNWR